MNKDIRTGVSLRVIDTSELFIAPELEEHYGIITVITGILTSSIFNAECYNFATPLQAYQDHDTGKYYVFAGYYFFIMLAELQVDSTNTAPKTAQVLLYDEKPRNIPNLSLKYMLSTQATHSSKLVAVKFLLDVVRFNTRLFFSQAKGGQQRPSVGLFRSIVKASESTVKRAFGG